MVPVVPLAAMFTVTLPGASAAKIACIKFVSWLMGPQFVSPKTRSPTSMSGNDNAAAIRVIHIGRSKIAC